MVLLKQIGVGLFYIFSAFILALSQVYATDCENAFLDFEGSIQGILNKNIVKVKDLKIVSDAFAKYESVLRVKACGEESVQIAAGYVDTIKEKRVVTIKRFIEVGQTEDEGVDLKKEYAGLTRGNKSYPYVFGNFFSKRIVKEKEANIASETTTFPEVAGCSNRINQNEAVNLKNARDQDSVGWCYAYTAADLLSYRFNQKISGVSLYSSDQPIRKDIVSKKALGSHINVSINNYIKKHGGLCLEKNLPSSDFKFCTNEVYSVFLQSILTKISENKFRSEYELPGSICLREDFKKIFPTTSLADIESLRQEYGDMYLAEKIFERECRDKIKVTKGSLKPTWVPKSDNAMRVLDQQLDANQVVGVTYDYNGVSPIKEEGHHASLAVGRRTNERGECEYLIRNSWGKGCDMVENADVMCHKNCEANGECRDSGHFWISKKKLSEVLDGVTYLK